MLWLYLLGIVNILIIVLRRVLRRQKPLSDELYSTKVAIDHVHSGVAWIRGDGSIASINTSLLATLRIESAALIGHNWLELFPESEREQLQEAYSQMLLMGTASLEAHGVRGDGSLAPLKILLVAVHDHKSRLFGYHCLAYDCSVEQQLQEQVHSLTQALEEERTAQASLSR